MLLGYALSPFGHRSDAWRQAPDDRLLGFDALLEQVSAADAEGLAFVLLADRLGLRPTDDVSPTAVPFEPTLLASALATRVGQIGMIAAAATNQHEPYNLARRFASLDLISKGRGGWLVVADGGHHDRDGEFVDVVTALWDSFEDDAFVYDKTAGRFFDPLKMHVAHHKGAYFTVRGPLNVNRSPQGRPVLAHLLDDADSALAIRTGELLLLQARSADDLVAAAKRIGKAINAAGRKRDDIRLVASISPVICSAGQGAEKTSAFSDIDQTVEPPFAARLAGTPSAIVEQLKDLEATADLDGFTVFPPTLEMGQRFLSEVVPELRRQGLMDAGSGTTLRERLGLPRQEHPSLVGKEASR